MGRLRGFRLVVLAACVAACVAACGGVASASPAVGAAFAAQAVAVCDRAYALKHAQSPFPFADFNPTRPDPTKLAAVAASLRETDATFTTWLSEMTALGDPPSGTSPWHDLLAAVKRHRDLNADQIAAAERGDVATFAADYQAGVATQAALLVAATAAGVAPCARVDR